MKQAEVEQRQIDDELSENYERERLEQEKRDIEAAEAYEADENRRRENYKDEDEIFLENPIENKKAGFKRKTISFVSSLGRTGSLISNRKSSKTRGDVKSKTVEQPDIISQPQRSPTPEIATESPKSTFKINLIISVI